MIYNAYALIFLKKYDIISLISRLKESKAMTHHMNLNPQPFSLIASGHKTIELRLLDEKRQLISVGDTLIFTNSQDGNSTLSCTVKKLHIFDSFSELYDSLPLDKCGYSPDELFDASPADMEEYYPIEKQKLYGVVGIEIELV